MSHTGVGDICPACTRISRGGGECRRTRGAAKHSTSAAPPSILGARGGCSAPSEHLLAPVMPPSRPAKAPPPLNYHPAASQPEMRSRRECGQPDVAASPGSRAHQMGRRLARHISGHMGEALPALGRLDSPPARNRGSQPPCTISQPRRPARPAGRAGRPSLFGGCPGRLLLAVRHSKVPRVPLRATLPLHGPHAHQRAAQIHPPLAPTAARRHSSGRQPMHLIDERPPEPRSNRGMDLIAVQASLHP